uniref:hypothetical protein n=1 Tax=Elizabethkingia anophelis TaxID=1117645 RepID=UPI001588CAF7
LKAPEGSAQQGFHLVSFGQDENLVIRDSFIHDRYSVKPWFFNDLSGGNGFQFFDVFPESGREDQE